MRRKSGDDFSHLIGKQAFRPSTAQILFLGLLAAASASGVGAQEELAARLRQATGMHEQTDYAHSIPILKELVRQYPHNYEANLLLGEDLLNSGSVQDAVIPLAAAAKLRPEEGTPEVYLAEAATSLKDYPRAVEALQAGVVRSGGAEPFVESYASFCIERYKIVESLLRATKVGEATALRLEAAVRLEGSKTREQMLERAVAGDPDQRGIWGELGMAQLELGMISEARDSLKEAEKREPRDSATLQLEALLAAVEQKWPVAQERFAALAARSPSQAEKIIRIWQFLFAPRLSTSGATWECLHDTKAACPSYLSQPHGGQGLKANELYTQGRWEQLAALPVPAATDRPALLWRGVALANTGNCERAIPLLERGLKADEKTAEFWVNICYASEGDRAVAQLIKQGNTTAIHQLKGDIMLRLRNDTAGAQHEYEEALKAEPQNPRLLERMAEVYRLTGDTDQARKMALAALAADPHDFSALQTLAQIAIHDRNYEEALGWLKQLQAIAPAEALTLVELGITYGQLGQPEEAVRYLGPQLAAGYPDKKGPIHAMLAKALRKLGRDAEAKQAEAEAERLANAALDSAQMGGGDAPE